MMVQQHLPNGQVFVQQGPPGGGQAYIQPQVYIQATGGVAAPQKRAQAVPSKWNALSNVLFWLTVPALVLAMSLGSAAASNGPFMFSFEAQITRNVFGDDLWGCDKMNCYGPCSSSLTFCEPFFADNQIPLSTINGTNTFQDTLTPRYRSAALAVALFPVAAGFLLLISGLCCKGYSNAGNCSCCGDSCASSPQSPCADTQMLRSTFIVGFLAIVIAIADLIVSSQYKSAVTTWSTSTTGLKRYSSTASNLAFQAGYNTSQAGSAFLLITGGLLLTAFTLVMCNPKKQPAPIGAPQEATIVVAQPQAMQGQYYPQQQMAYPSPNAMMAPALGQPMMQQPQAHSPYPQGLMTPALQQSPQPQGGYPYPPQQPGFSQGQNGYYPQPMAPQASPQYPYPGPMPSATAPAPSAPVKTV